MMNELERELTIDENKNTTEFDYFGVSVSLSGDGSTLAVGAHYAEFAIGSVYVY